MLIELNKSNRFTLSENIDTFKLKNNRLLDNYKMGYDSP